MRGGVMEESRLESDCWVSDLGSGLDGDVNSLRLGGAGMQRDR